MKGPMFREATAEDRGFAYEVKRAAFREYAEKVWGWDEAEQRQLHDSRFDPGDYRVIGLRGTDVGIVALAVAADAFVVNQLFVLPEFQDRGIGRRCMELLMEEADRLGLPVRLRVLKVNPRALRFYLRLGFTGTGETETHHTLEWQRSKCNAPLEIGCASASAEER